MEHEAKNDCCFLITENLGRYHGIDESIVEIALPFIATDFGVDAGIVAWTITIFLLAVIGTIFIFGTIAKRGYIKQIVVIGYILLTVTSILCGLSTSLPMLIVMRLIQGIGGSMIIASAPIICVKFMPKDVVGVAFATLAAASSVGFLIGAIGGGILLDLLSWPWIFYANVPICVFSIFYCLKVIPKEVPVKGEKFDWLGSILVFLSIVFFTFAIEELPYLGIGMEIVGSIALFILTFILFCINELKASTPLLNIRVFKSFRVDAVISAFLIIEVIYYGLLYTLPFYLNGIMKVDAIMEGIYIMIPLLITALVSIPIANWSDKTGRRWFMVVASAMLVLTSIGFAIIQPEWGVMPLIVNITLLGLALGIMSGPGSGWIVELMPKGEEELGSMMVVMLPFMGGILGTAIYAMIFTLITTDDGVIHAIEDLPIDLFLQGFNLTMIVGIVLAIIAVVLSFVVKRDKCS